MRPIRFRRFTSREKPQEETPSYSAMTETRPRARGAEKEPNPRARGSIRGVTIGFGGDSMSTEYRLKLESAQEKDRVVIKFG
ncbi:hypothetical protein Tco_0955774 [Tanacetum coccineum]|uniref:Uncharacterized protein n=1 Tax=Tanacetum coccineum TaxID=301880 RepID=A0ABQ5E861_9ASTR